MSNADWPPRTLDCGLRTCLEAIERALGARATLAQNMSINHAAARPPAAATRCRTVVWLNIPPNPVAICRLGAAARLATLNSQPSTINYLEPHHLPDMIQQLEFGVGRDQVPAPGHWRRQSAALALTLPIRLHRI